MEQKLLDAEWPGWPASSNPIQESRSGPNNFPERIVQKIFRSLENVFFLSVAIGLLLASVAAGFIRTHIHFHKDRVQYGMEHLPAALFMAFLFVVLVGVLRIVLSRNVNWEDKPGFYYLAAIIAAFCIVWVPIELNCNFVRDDWMLLSATVIRKVLFTHPTFAWHTLDSIDGNFRPLGTALYLGVMLKLFGMHLSEYFAGTFLVNLMGCLVAFFIVRELGYSKVAGAAASILYMTRDMAYTEYIWISAISDALSILLCGVTVLALLKASKRRGGAAVVYHVVAWVSFFAAGLSKQTAFAIPAIAALLLLLRPGTENILPLRRRVISAFAALLIYGATAGVIFFHAKALLESKTPYPMSLNFYGLAGSFSYIVWFFAPLDFAGKYKTLSLFFPLIGLAVVIGVVELTRRVPRIAGPRPKDLVFVLLAAVACLGLLFPLGGRVAPYYGAMFAFWLSIAFGIALTRFEDARPENRPGRIACFVFCLMVMTGFLAIHLKQTALIPSGGYVWGTYGMDLDRARRANLSKLFAASPSTDTLVLADFPEYPSPYASMAMLDAPQIKQILIYNSASKTFLDNGHRGHIPMDGYSALNDVQAYTWNLPISSLEAHGILSNGQTLWVEFGNEKIISEPYSPDMAR
jgi:hypothetical protein